MEKYPYPCRRSDSFMSAALQIVHIYTSNPDKPQGASLVYTWHSAQGGNCRIALRAVTVGFSHGVMSLPSYGTGYLLHLKNADKPSDAKTGY
jgi:hypothetical protein